MANIVLSPAQTKLLKTWTVIANDAVAKIHTGTTAELIQATVNLAAGSMGPNGALRITAVHTCLGSGGTRTPRLRFSGIGGTIFTQAILAIADRTWHWTTVIRNRGLQNSQIGTPTSGLVQVGNNLPVVGAIDTTLAQTLVFTAQLVSAADSLTLEAYTVELMYGA